MRRKTVGAPTRRGQEWTHSDGDGNRIHNEILLSLPIDASRLVFPKLELVRLRPRQVLHEVGDTLKSAYFCNGGLISILTSFPNGKNIEIAVVGTEGFVGLPLVAGFQSAVTRAIVQLEGTAFRIDASTLDPLLRQCTALERRLQQFSQMKSAQISQIAACNLLHQMKERLARWLLMCHDRKGSDTMALTQELLAEMLGTRRPSVTLAAGALQKAGSIAYGRGQIRIQNRTRLTSAACECYEAMRRQARVWRNEATNGVGG